MHIAANELMKKVGMLMGINVTSGNWKSENEMIGIVTEAETLYYGGIRSDFFYNVQHNL